MAHMKQDGRKFALGCLAGALLALISPWITLTQLFASMPMLLFPAVGLAIIYRRAGKGAAWVSGFLVLLSFGWFTGSVFMWAVFLLVTNPLMTLMRIGDRPFFEQLRMALFGFGMGLVMTVVMLYFAYGADLVSRLMGAVPALIHAMPVQDVEAALAAMPGMTVDAAAFIARVDELFAGLARSFELLLPGKLFSGALLTAVFCTLLPNRMQQKAGLAKPGCYVPLSRWYLPASVVSGMGILMVVGAMLVLMEAEGGQAVFQTVYEIAVWVFVIQALASFSRRLEGVLAKHSVKILLLCLSFVIALLGGASYIAIYGFVSALLGSRGVIRLKFEGRRQDRNKYDDPGDGND